MDHLKELCEDLEIEPKEAKQGAQFLRLNESLSIGVKNLEPGVFLSSPICPLPKMKREELLIHLMKANLFGQGTLGAVIGFKENESLLTLSLAMPYDMEYRLFREAFEDFANIVEFWRDEVDLHIEKAQNEIL